jgi:hypothetical protein
MIVYRVQNHKGSGFYHDGFYGNFPPVQYWYPIFRYCSEDAQSSFLGVIHPRTTQKIQDQVYKEGSTWVFGFQSKKAMLDWFPEQILKGVPEFGGKIVKYEIDSKHVSFLDKQCIFDISKAKII